jgi:hypothetical protein
MFINCTWWVSFLIFFYHECTLSHTGYIRLYIATGTVNNRIWNRPTTFSTYGRTSYQSFRTAPIRDSGHITSLYPVLISNRQVFTSYSTPHSTSMEVWKTDYTTSAPTYIPYVPVLLYIAKFQHRTSLIACAYSWTWPCFTSIDSGYSSNLFSFNPFQPSDAMWCHTFHLSLICMSFAQWFQ